MNEVLITNIVATSFSINQAMTVKFPLYQKSLINILIRPPFSSAPAPKPHCVGFRLVPGPVKYSSKNVVKYVIE